MCVDKSLLRRLTCGGSALLICLAKKPSMAFHAGSGWLGVQVPVDIASSSDALESLMTSTLLSGIPNTGLSQFASIQTTQPSKSHLGKEDGQDWLFHEVKTGWQVKHSRPLCSRNCKVFAEKCVCAGDRSQTSQAGTTHSDARFAGCAAWICYDLMSSPKSRRHTLIFLPLTSSCQM